MAAARLLAAVVDARTPLDGLTDNEHGHPQYRALETRDRALVRAILSAALRHRRTIESLVAARLEKPLLAPRLVADAPLLSAGAVRRLDRRDMRLAPSTLAGYLGRRR